MIEGIGSEPMASSEPLLLVARAGHQTVAIPAAAVEHVLRMVALTPLPDAPPGVVGLVDVHGSVLAVVDPRPRLGVETPGLHPDQYLVVIAARSRYLLWLDGVDRVISAGPDVLESVGPDEQPGLATSVLRLDGNLVPVLSADVLDPGPMVGASQTSYRPKASSGALYAR